MTKYDKELQTGTEEYERAIRPMKEYLEKEEEPRERDHGSRRDEAFDPESVPEKRRRRRKKRR